MSSRLGIAGIVLLAAFGLAACGGGGGGTASTDGGDPPPPPDPAPQAVSGHSALSAEAQARLRAQLPDTGDSATISVPAGATVSRAGVDFTCNSAYDCTVALENSLGTIVAMWSSQVLEGQDDPTLTAMATGPTTASGSIALSNEVMGNLNAGPMPYPYTLMIADGEMKRVNGVVFSCNTEATSAYCRVTLSQGDDGTISATWSSEVAYGVDPAENPGMASVYDPTTQMNPSRDRHIASATANANDTATAPAIDVDVVTNSIIGPTAGVGPEGFGEIGVTAMLDPNGPDFNPNDLAASPGTTVGAMDDIETAATGMAGDANAVRLPGWQHRAMHADWGDTRDRDRDGGFETFALLYSNIESPTDVDFTVAAATIASDTIRPWFQLTVLADGMTPSAPATPTSVAITVATTASDQTNAMLFDRESLVPTQNRDPEVNVGEDFSGTYFGAAGRFQCASANGCGIMRDGNNIVPVLAASTWTFTPDSGATVRLPDQDWIAFGVWVTSPDVHTAANMDSLGVQAAGMDTYGYGSPTAALTGKATYSGGAAGAFVDGSETGLFTATAKLEANFDTDMLSGSINDFRNTRGEFLGADTQAEPNDRAAGGENDWVVNLGATEINDAGTFDNDGETSGSADGNSWAGQWNAQLYGGGDRLAAPAGVTDFLGHAPSGVAGTFNARTNNLVDTPGMSHKGVAGAFGATLDAGSHGAND